MSTDLLVRRMDLIHEYNAKTKINNLVMDTTYPAKISGLVLKLYKANTHGTPIGSYNEDDIVYTIKNRSNEIIVEITKANTLDFNGDQLKSFPKYGEYVMTVIDINNAKIHICSESMFSQLVSPEAKTMEFIRRLKNLDGTYIDGKYIDINSDPIIDMASFDPNEYYEDKSGAQRIIDVDTLTLTNKDLGEQKAVASIIALYKNKGLQPALYGGNISSAKKDNKISPLDTVAPGTLKLFHGIDPDTVDLAKKTEGEIYKNYSFVRDNEYVIHHLNHDTSITEKNNKYQRKLVPISDTIVSDINSIRTSVTSSFYPMAINHGNNFDSVNFVDSVVFYNRINGFTISKFKEMYGIDSDIVEYPDGYDDDGKLKTNKNYSTKTLYESMIELRNHPLTAQSATLHESLTEEERKKYYYVYMSILEKETNTNMQGIIVPVRKSDNYIDINFKTASNLLCNNHQFIINSSLSSTDFVGKWWNDSKYCGFGIIDSNGTPLLIADDYIYSHKAKPLYTDKGLSSSGDPYSGPIRPIKCKFDYTLNKIPDKEGTAYVETEFIVNFDKYIAGISTEKPSYILDVDGNDAEFSFTKDDSNAYNGGKLYFDNGNTIGRLTIYKVYYPPYVHYEKGKLSNKVVDEWYYMYRLDALNKDTGEEISNGNYPQIRYLTARPDHPTMIEASSSSGFFQQGESIVPKPPTEYDNNFIKWLKDIPCWKLFGTNENAALTKMRQINHVGIHEGYIYSNYNEMYDSTGARTSVKAEYSTVFDLLQSFIVRDVAIDPNSDKSYRTGSSKTLYVYPKSEIKRIDPRKGTGNFFDVDNNNIEIQNNMILSYSTNPKFLFGSEEAKLIDNDNVDYSTNSDNKISIVNNVAGLHQTMSISLTDENNQMLPLFGTSGDINVDNINWFNLLLSLNNNKQINILGILGSLKQSLNSINSNDIYTIKKNPSTGTIELGTIYDTDVLTKMQNYILNQASPVDFIEDSKGNLTYTNLPNDTYSGVLEIGGAPYKFVDGILKTGEVSDINGRTYKYNTDTGNIVLGWAGTVGKSNYYSLIDGKITNQTKVIDGVVYSFNAYGNPTPQ